MDTLYRSYRMLLSNISTDFIRYLHDEIEWDSKLIAILGPRGVGKTTMLLQHIKLYDNIDETLFVTADDLYFAEHKLIDLAMDFYQHGGKRPCRGQPIFPYHYEHGGGFCCANLRALRRFSKDCGYYLRR